jgi:Glutaredoxin
MAFLNRLSHLARTMGSTASRAGPSSLNSMSARTVQLIDSAVEDNFITVFSKSYCPYCRRAKALINTLDLPEGKTVKIFEYVD